jgi:hypothetical protein
MDPSFIAAPDSESIFLNSLLESHLTTHLFVSHFESEKPARSPSCHNLSQTQIQSVINMSSSQVLHCTKTYAWIASSPEHSNQHPAILCLFFTAFARCMRLLHPRGLSPRYPNTLRWGTGGNERHSGRRWSPSVRYHSPQREVRSLTSADKLNPQQFVGECTSMAYIHESESDDEEAPSVYIAQNWDMSS